jgi:hypothetical protein
MQPSFDLRISTFVLRFRLRFGCVSPPLTLKTTEKACQEREFDALIDQSGNLAAAV